MEQLDIEYLKELDRVIVLLHPLRLKIMELATEETSGTQAARWLGLPRQMVNYHFLALEKAGFLIRVGEVRRRNMFERRYRSSARSYLISPDILGSLSVTRRRPAAGSASALLALAGRVQTESGENQAADFPALSLSSTVGFAGPSQHGAFTRAMSDAVAALVREHASSAPADGRYRLVLALYPLPSPSSSESPSP